MTTEIYDVKYIKLRDWIPLDKLNWSMLSRNPNAIHILEKNLDKVDWETLSRNPNAIPILEKNLDKVDYCLCFNCIPNAIQILEKNLDKCSEVSWVILSKNPNIFVYDYEAIKNTMYKEGGFVEELMQNRFHPKNMHMWTDWGFESPIDDE